ncbi:hypothetical protein C4B68_34185 [Streptomyces dengpaensis]|uniref:Scaffolding protein n=1 Tax=Streptomyces dengpaensis TaxID=2049881 RepID=A0ABM6SZT0_9ACTN|nr:hypothetical protein C4B68_34185 [Streptomyces dengpaensis]PIB09639.1 hypothetical protein B1C81_10860 [Streptomyces sp. HG99]
MARAVRGISLPPRTIVGYVAGRPVYNIAGGAEGDEQDTDVDMGDESGTEDPDRDEPEAEPGAEPDEEPKPKPPAKKAAPKPGDDDYVAPSRTEWERTQAALKKANDDAKRHRLRNKELEEKTRADETEHEKALRLAREEGEKKFRAPLVRTAARSALVEAGALAFLSEEKEPNSREAREKGESRLSRLMKLLDTDVLDVDEDGAVSGLEAAVDDLRADYPELFAAPRSKPKARPTGAPRPAAPEKPKSAAEQHAARVLGRA